MQNKMFDKTEGYVQSGNPFPVSSCGRRRNRNICLNDGIVISCRSINV